MSRVRRRLILIIPLALSSGCTDSEPIAKFRKEHIHQRRFAVQRLWNVRQQLFYMSDDFKRFREGACSYPSRWSDLVPWIQPGRRDRDSRVAAPASATWTIEELGHQLVIERADGDGYVVGAFDFEGRRTFEMDECGRPRQLLPLYCECYSSRLEELDDEPKSFLMRTKRYFMYFFHGHDRYPRTWAETREVVSHNHGLAEMHWLNVVRHLEDDPLGLAPEDATSVWHPFGSDFSYVLSHPEPGNYEIRSWNDLGMKNYAIRGDVSEPYFIASAQLPDDLR